MQLTTTEDSAISYVGLFGGDADCRVPDFKELWRGEHKEEKKQTAEEKPTLNEWIKTCLGSTKFFGGDFTCEYIVEIDKKIVKILAGKPFEPIAIDLPVTLSISDLTKSLVLEQEFNELASQWYRETRMFSFVRQKALHPCYQKIIGMGKDALPFIFRELSEGRGDWMWALDCIVRPKEKLVPKNSSFKEAVSIWLQWGRDNNYIH